MAGEYSFDFEHAISRLEDEQQRVGGRSSARAASEASVCRHWLRGICSKGELCDFLHHQDFTRRSNNSSSSVNNNNGINNSISNGINSHQSQQPHPHPHHHHNHHHSHQQQQQSAQQICRAWETTGRCQDPTRCPYAHSGSTPLCVQYFLGFCSAGVRCRLRHEKRPPDSLPPLVPDWYLHLVLANSWQFIPQDIDAETEKLMDLVEAQCRQAAGENKPPAAAAAAGAATGGVQ